MYCIQGHPCRVPGRSFLCAWPRFVRGASAGVGSGFPGLVSWLRAVQRVRVQAGVHAGSGPAARDVQAGVRVGSSPSKDAGSDADCAGAALLRSWGPLRARSPEDSLDDEQPCVPSYALRVVDLDGGMRVGDARFWRLVSGGVAGPWPGGRWTDAAGTRVIRGRTGAGFADSGGTGSYTDLMGKAAFGTPSGDSVASRRKTH